ncbi:MAG: hypothetical protein A2172_03675 [Candidatus Woykebacteria bacterium RBG_13_40_15]|uniref:GtrA/DPMS transmembrane domain-containing protein n=1 Tax=Candidatus Woykebacteria bacterium RBG_13_40_15 TaxID=1802593 RepID=A0A1G1WAL9_9BACT|nr:MAG: hypothetical protein A2172_03675 [Candidatus Woykebacteria bacterium RBG_13_40_15]
MLKAFTFKTFNLINRYEHLRQIIVYLFVGGLSAFLDIVLLFILVDVFHIWYLFAATISFISVSTLGFFLHKRLTFRYQGRRTKLRYVAFLFIAGSGLVWSLVLLYTFVDIFKIWYLFAAIMVKFIVLVWNFLMNKFITFGSYKKDNTLRRFLIQVEERIYARKT